MNESLWTFVFEIANFVALAAALAWLFFKPVRAAIADEQARARRLEEDAARKLAHAEQVRKEIEAQRHALSRELEKSRTEAHENAKHEAQQTLAEARQRIERDRAALKREALNIKRAQMARIAAAVARATYGTMGRFLRQLEGPELEQTLIESACRELRGLSNGSLAPVTVESAAPLNDDARRRIDSSLGDAAATADFRVVPELQGGVRIATAHGLIDASLAGLANFAEQLLSAELESIMREESESE